jgi:AraC-like DNA-binding protein
MVRGAERLGHDPSKALAIAHISDSELQRPDSSITAAQMERLSAQLMKELDDEALGWFSRKLPWGSYGMLARASISSPTLEVAMKRWCRHHALLTTDLLLSLAVAPDENNHTCATVSVVECSVGPWMTNELREFCHVSLLRNLFGFASWLVDSRIPALGVDFAFPAPRHVSAYSILFPGRCDFDQPITRLRFDSKYLQLSVRRSETELQTMLKRALPLTVLSYRKDRLLVSRVQYTLSHQPETFQNAILLANTLGISERTLHRQLKAEGTSLQTIKDKTRRDLVTKHLETTQLPLKSIAKLAGFRNDKSLIRAFRNWSGLSPLQYLPKQHKTY